MDAFSIARLATGGGFLAAAALFDLRTRHVRDPLWIALGSIGLGLLALQLLVMGAYLNAWLLVVSAAILFYAVFYGRPLLEEDGFHPRPLRILVLAAALAAFLAALLLPYPVIAISAAQQISPFPSGAVDPFVELISMPILIVVYQGLYQVGLIRGGADAKGMIALTLLVPVYPDASPFPLLSPPATVLRAMQVAFPFSLVAFVNAAILFLVVPIGYLIVNVIRGDLEWPQAFFGTKASLDSLPTHSWLMERVDAQGERVLVLFPSHRRDEAAEAAKLRAAGADRVWVQPKVPFLVPLLFGFLLAFLVGNLMLAFLAAVLPVP